MKDTPYIAFRRRADIEPGTAVGQAIDDLVAWAKDNGCMDTELEERLQEALYRYDEAN